MRHQPLALAMALLGGAWAAPASATSVVLLSEESLIDRADLILNGTVLSSESAFRAGPIGVFTDVALDVQEVLKGTFTEELIHIGMPGGELDGRRVSYAGVPSFAPGEQVVVFLVRMADGSLTTVGVSQGKYRLEVDSQTGLTMARQAGGGETRLPVVVTGQTNAQALRAGAPTLTDWDVFRRRIRTRVSGGSGE